MALDPHPLGLEVARLMGDLEDTYGDDAKLMVAVAIVEVRYESDGEKATSVHIAGLDSASRSRIIGALFRAQGLAAWPQATEDTD